MNTALCCHTQKDGTTCCAVALKNSPRCLAQHAFTACLILSVATASAQQTRPAITGISHMCVYAGDLAASDHFYAHILGAAKGADPLDPAGTRYYFSATQFVEVLPLPADHTLSRMACAAYNTADAAVLRAYMHSHGVDSASEVQTASDGSRWFKVKDPEGNQIRFIQPGRPPQLGAADPISTRIIHIGYQVHSKAA
jgi:catechol 2,3-dioxygenase-like lactoylglutathione lyase family enzyme